MTDNSAGRSVKLARNWNDWVKKGSVSLVVPMVTAATRVAAMPQSRSTKSRNAKTRLHPPTPLAVFLRRKGKLRGAGGGGAATGALALMSVA